MGTKVYDWVAYHAAQTPNKTAQIDLHRGRSWTWADMNTRTARLAQGLVSQYGIEKGDRIAILANNSTDYLEFEYACQKTGAVMVPLNWRLTVPELEYILSDCAPKLLLHEDVFADTAASVVERCGIEHVLENNAAGSHSSYEQLIADSKPMQGMAELDHDDLWVVMYTSGTTGHPKGCMITHGMTFFNVVNLLNPHRLAEHMVNLCVLPLFHTGGLNCYSNPAVHMGGTNLIMRSYDPGECLALLQDPQHKVSHILAVPANYLFMSQHPSFETANFDSVTTLGIGGAPTPVELINAYAAKGKGLQQGFGMTETSPVVTALTDQMALEKIGSAGLPCMHNEIRIVDEDGNDMPEPNKVGELWVRGPNITPGYWNRPDANESSFTGRWLHTGDAAYVDEDGYLFIVDRWKDMYISGGENVYPAEVENVIYQLPQVSEVAVIGVADERWGEVGQAVIVLKPGESLAEDEVLKHCKRNLARFKQPASVRFIDEIPHNATGKVLKRELRA